MHVLHRPVEMATTFGRPITLEISNDSSISNYESLTPLRKAQLQMSLR